MSQTFSSVFDHPPVAAMGLGFCTRDYCSGDLNDCLLTLANEIHANIFTSLNRLMAKIDRSYDEFEAALNKARSTAEALKKWNPDFTDHDALCRFADHSFADGSSLLRWYRVGAALGDCELAHRKNKLTSEHLDAVVAYLRRLPIEVRSDVTAVKRLLDNESPVSPIEAFGQALDPVAEDRTADISAQRMSIIHCFIRALITGVGQLPLSLQDSRQDARDRWLYEQVRNQVPHKKILSELKSQKWWDPIGSAQGILAAVNRFIDRKGLLRLPTRQPGRRRGRK